MSRAKGKRIIRRTGLIMAVILLLTGAASILAWGTNGYIDWTFGNWKNAAQNETPGEEPTPQATGYAFTVPGKTAVRTYAASSRAVPEGAEAEYNTYLQSDSRNKDLTTAENLAKFTIKNNVDGQTVSAAVAGVKVMEDDSMAMGKAMAWLIPRIVPFEHLQAGYIYKDTVCKVNGTEKPNMFKGKFEHWDYYIDKVLPAAIEITFIFEQDPNAVQPLPPDPVKEGYTFTGWYYGTDEEHGENCTKYIGETVTSNINLHAHFEINRYTVTFDTNGGKAIDSQTVNWDTAITPPTPERRGYEFKGWFFADGTEYTGQAIKQDTTLKAHWEIKTFTVTFYVGGEVYATKEVDYGTTFAELAEEAKGLNLRVLSVMTENGEQPLEYFSGAPITEDYSVVSDKLSAREIVINALQKYPWIIFAGGGALSVLVGIVGVIASVVQTRKPARRRRR